MKLFDQPDDYVLSERFEIRQGVNPYKAFSWEQMPNLIADGRIPISISDLMKRQLEVQDKTKFSDKVREEWMRRRGYDSGDGIIYHPEGKFKIIFDSRDLRNIDTKTKLKEGALVLPEGTYERLEGPEFNVDQIRRYLGRPVTKEKAKLNPVLQALARDQRLLEDYVDFMCPHSDCDSMGLYLADSVKNVELRPWYVAPFDSSLDGKRWIFMTEGIVGIKK